MDTENMKRCPNCDGDGIVGSGETPHLKQGHIVTCTVCQGTGSVPVNSTAQEAPVDNTPEAKVKRGGILGMLGF